MLNGTAFWTMSVKTANVGPTPRPAMNIQTHTIGIGVSARSWVIRDMPMAMTTMRADEHPLVAAGPGDDQAGRRSS